MCGQAYLTSARIAGAVGTFAMYAKNDEPFLEVIRMHRGSVSRIGHRNFEGHDPQRKLLQVRQLRRDQRLQLGEG